MPSQFSSQSSINDALEVCKKFDIKHEIISIEPMVSGFIKENISKITNNYLDEIYQKTKKDEI